jgi:hypothetical protein
MESGKPKSVKSQSYIEDRARGFLRPVSGKPLILLAKLYVRQSYKDARGMEDS